MTEYEPMTEQELEIVGLAFELRCTEEQRGNGPIWFGVWPHAVPEAHSLAEQGWLHRRTSPDLEWRLSDEGLGALHLTSPLAEVSWN